MDIALALLIISTTAGFMFWCTTKLDHDVKIIAARLDQQAARSDQKFDQQIARSDQQMAIFSQRTNEISQRTDQLYQMYLDILERNNGRKR